MASEWPALVDRASVWVYNDLVDEVIHGVVFDVHRSTKLGLYLLLEDGLSNNDQVMSTGTTAGNSDEGEESRGSFGGGNPFTDDGGNDSLPMMVGLDVFGTSTTNQKKTAECLCPNCQRNMAASRFAPHLEKCMGMGRNSSRLASRRIASSATREAAMASDDDNEDDHEWMGSGASERSKKRKKEKHSSSGRRMKVPKKDLTNGPGAPSLTYNALTAPEASEVEAMSLADRRSLLSTMCGVVSGHTGRMCTRSLKCPQHSENQRRGVREVMLPAPPPMDDDSLSNNAGPMDAGMQQQQHHEIDVDTWEEGDSLASLLTQSQAAEEFQGSPAESTSTTSSTSSKKKDNKIKTVRRRSKVDF